MWMLQCRSVVADEGCHMSGELSVFRFVRDDRAVYSVTVIL